LPQDLLWSVLLKPTCRRVRPYWAGQKQLGTVETVDQYSFPSGHSTRAVFVACFAHYVYTLGLISENMALAVVV
jgi:membrane-associated phospholipid phosphatase